MGLVQDMVNWQPTKVQLGWTAVGSVVATVAVGFMLGLVVTSGAAADMAAKAQIQGQTEVAAHVCAANFRLSEAAVEQHAELSGLSNTRQRQFVQGQPWAAVPGLETVSRDTADLCARLIVAMDPDEFALPMVEDA